MKKTTMPSKLNIKPRTKQNLHAFTLIEIVVAIGIFALIASLVLANFRQGQKEDDLRLATTELASNIRKVQNLGMSGQITGICEGGGSDGKFCEKSTESADCPSGTCEDSVPAGGYGINIILPPENDPGTAHYHLFADNGDQKYGMVCEGGLNDGGTCTEDGQCRPDGECVLQDKILAGGNINIPPGTEIVDAAVSSLILSRGSEPLPVDISFQPPKPTPWFRTGGDIQDVPLENAEICFELTQNAINSCRLIRVNGVSGQVREEPWVCGEQMPCES